MSQIKLNLLTQANSRYVDTIKYHFLFNRFPKNQANQSLKTNCSSAGVEAVICLNTP